MYKKIDDFYKKNSPYKKIKIWTYILSFFVTLLLLAFSTIKNYFIPLLIIFILAIFIMKKIYEKILNEKLYFNFSNKNNSGVPLDNLINEKEKNMVVGYLKENNLYNKDAIKCILEHYRCFIKTKAVNSNFLAILSIIITVILAFVTKEGFDINSFSVSIPYILSLILIFILIYYPISKVISLKKVFTGEDGLEERLESIFSELYVYFNEKNNIKKSKNGTKKIKINNSKQLKKKWYLLMFFIESNRKKLRILLTVGDFLMGFRDIP